MMFSSALHRVAVLGTSALVASMAAVVPASAATTGQLSYTCDAPLGPYTFKVSADTSLPATAPPGAALSGTATYTVVIPDSLRNTMYGLAGARFVEGTAAIKATSFGTPATLDGTLPKTPIPASGELTVVATSALAMTAPATAGAYQVVAGDFTTKIKLTKADGSPATVPEADVSCTLNPGQNAVVDTLTVDPAAPVPTPPQTPAAKVDSTTTAKAAYVAKAKKAVVKVKVVAADGTPGTGKVKVTMKLGTKTRAVQAVLSASGSAKAVFTKVTKKGRYVFTAAYPGSGTHNPSKKKVVLRIR